MGARRDLGVRHQPERRPADLARRGPVPARAAAALAGPLLTLLLAVAGSPASGATDAQDGCGSTADVSRFYGQGWGLAPGSTRNLAASETRIDAGNVATLTPAWTFNLDNGDSPHAFPAVTPDTVFIGTDEGNLYALARHSGCVRWRFAADDDIRTAIVPGAIETTHGPAAALFFGTREGTVYAVDAASGELRWQRDADPHRFAMVTGSPSYHDGMLYVPVSSYELLVAAAPIYECCSFRGSVVALDASSGEPRWQTYTIAEPAKQTSSYWLVFDRYGPSGAPVWSSPTVDGERGLLYVGTGENYSDPPSAMSDAIIAMDLASGEIRWHRQFLAGDAWNASCALPVAPACPQEEGPDFDFGAPPILARTRLGQDILLAGQKSGDVFALDPDDGETLWQTRIGRGGKLGGIHWGMAASESHGLLYVPVSDRGTGESTTGGPSPGLHALSIDSGEQYWQVSQDGLCAGREDCFPGVSAAVTATSDLVFAGTLSGLLQAFDASSGEILWRHDTWGEQPAVNAETARGAAIDVHGPMLADDMLFVTSGYAGFGQAGGNAFMAFKLAPAVGTPPVSGTRTPVEGP